MSIEQIVSKIRQLGARERALQHSSRDREEVRNELTQVHRALTRWRTQLQRTLIGEKVRALRDFRDPTWSLERHKMIQELATIDEQIEELLHGKDRKWL